MYCPKCDKEYVQSDPNCDVCDTAMLQEKPKPKPTAKKAAAKKK